MLPQTNHNESGVTHQKRKKPDSQKFAQFDTLSEEEQLSRGVKWMAEAMGIPNQAFNLRERVSDRKFTLLGVSLR